ncbi:flippase [Geobacter sp. SVR]|uniref:flippase n=1 Tax=Geobacter sp. SVR TaxID=2495594 RepID=UPI00143F0546|nr:flippase [Geobacter sp. SVR]BCS51975.1 O-unit flippase [Geobacter sp. SVR]GCF87210.1 O-unit flippase [Geobacter sp. SVR]
MDLLLSKHIPGFIRDRLEGRHNLQRVVANISWLFVDNIIRMGVGMLVGVWVARYLGPEQYGRINYATAFVSLFFAVTTLGLDSIVVREIVKDTSSSGEILGSAFILKLLGGITTFILSLVIIIVSRPNDTITHWLVGITSLGTVFQSLDTINFWFQSQVKSKYVVYAKSCAFLIISMIKIVFIISKAPLIAFAWTGFAEIVLGSCGLVIVYRLYGQTLKTWSATVRRMQNLLNESWPLIFSGIAIYVQARIDQVMLGDMLGNVEVGQFSAAMKLIEVFGFVPMIIQSTIAPSITMARAVSDRAYYTRLLNLYRLMFLLFLSTAIPIFLFAKEFVVFFYGNNYAAAGVLLSLFAIRLLFTNFGVAKDLYITNEGLFRYSLITSVLGCIANIVLNYVLIPRYASVGAIISMIISFAITIFIVDLFFEQLRKNLKVMFYAIITPWKITLH